MHDDTDLRPFLERADRFDGWFAGEVRAYAARPSIPTSMAFVFHDDVLSGFLEGPAYAVEDADRIVEGFSLLIPQLRPQHVIVVLAARFELEDGSGLWAAKVLRWSRGEPGWRQQIWPIHVDGDPAPHDPWDQDLLDPWCERLVTMFDQPPVTPPGVVNTLVLPDDVHFYPAARGPLAPAVPLHTLQ